MRISDVLRSKGAAVHTVPPSTTVGKLLSLLAEHNIGAVVVADGDRVAGIVSERDVVRQLSNRGAALLEVEVAAIMTSTVVGCAPEDTVDDVLAVMTARRFRHSPVLVEGKLGGIVSIGDLVFIRMRELERDREQLESYITSGG